MKNKNLLKITIALFLITYVFVGCDKVHEFPTIKEMSDGYVYNNRNRELIVEDSADNIYEYNTIKYISSRISGNVKDVFDELLATPYDDITIDNFIKQYSEGYGAKKISIKSINTYKTLDRFRKDEQDIDRLKNLNIDNINFNENNVVHVLYDFSYTAKSIEEAHVTFSEGIKSQYYVLNKTDNKIVYIEFLGN